MHCSVRFAFIFNFNLKSQKAAVLNAFCADKSDVYTYLIKHQFMMEFHRHEGAEKQGNHLLCLSSSAGMWNGTSNLLSERQTNVVLFY